MGKAAKITKITTHVLQEMKLKGIKIAMLTAYDYSMARIIDSANIDIMLVGDSASNVMSGHKTTLPRLCGVHQEHLLWLTFHLEPIREIQKKH